MLLSGAKDAEGRLYITAAVPDAQSTYMGRIARTYRGQVHVLSNAPLEGEALIETIGASNWICPPGVTSISVICAGRGGDWGVFQAGVAWWSGGSGAALAYVNDFPVTPGNSYPIYIGGSSSEDQLTGRATFNTNTCGAAGGRKGLANAYPTPGGAVLFGTGFSGGASGVPLDTLDSISGSGGAAGYTGTGGKGGDVPERQGTAGAGGGGGGSVAAYTSSPAGGGGVGLFGEGTNGATGWPGRGGSGGTDGTDGVGGKYGGGGSYGQNGGIGGIRIVWPGATRHFPNSNVGPTVGLFSTLSGLGQLDIVEEGPIAFYYAGLPMSPNSEFVVQTDKPALSTDSFVGGIRVGSAGMHVTLVVP